MGLNYKKKHAGNDSDSFWTSYSDLFLGLSSIFLMLYVVASLRTGTDTVRVMTDNQNLKIQVQELENTLKTYENIKQDYLQKQASKSEVDEYNELMDKLTLLQAEARDEKDQLRKTAEENEKKEMALNKYQQMVRNILNANKLAKVKIENRNEIIDEKEEIIDVKDADIQQKQQQISGLNQNVQSLQQNIKAKDQEMAEVNAELSKKMQQLQTSLKRAKLTKQAYAQRVKKLREEAQKELEELQSERQQVAANLGTVQRQLASTKSALETKQSELAQTQTELVAKDEQVQGLQSKLGSMQAETQAKISALRDQVEKERAGDRAAFEAELRKQKNLGAAEVAKREGEFAARMAAKERKIAGEISGLQGQLKDTEQKLASANAELAARKGIAEEIQKGFKKAGIRADINPETGDVVIDFGQAYFDVNSANLKEEMRSVLEKAMPVYSKSLFGNPKIAKMISNVEVIGFASPTYQGRVVDPYSNKPQDREAIKYNMDLSYRRARSIFNYILDEKDMNFPYRESLVPALKVSGRSFLDLMKMDRSIASADEYCKKRDCKKEQRVIIRFNVDNTK